MNQPTDRIEKLETRVTKLEQSRLSDDFLLKDIVHKATITQGLVTQVLGELSDFKQNMQERLSQLDDRVTEAHTELAEMRLAMATKDDISVLKITQDARFERIEATQDEMRLAMATKDDISALKITQGRQERILQEILDRLPPKQ